MIKMNTKIVVLALSFLVFGEEVKSEENENLLWVSYNQNSFDFFDDGVSKIKPNGIAVGFSKELNDEFILTLSYGDSQGDVSSTLFENNNIRLVNSAKTESTSIGVSLSWLSDGYGLTFSYNQLDTNESSNTRLPLTSEDIDADDQVWSFSYDNTTEMKLWDFGWSVGVQYYQSEISSHSRIEAAAIIELDAAFDTKSVSAFIDLDFSKIIEFGSMEITPQLSLSWNSELTNSGDELLTIRRAGERRAINQLSDRLATNFRTPDSGIWELGVGFEWKNGWGASVAYGQSFAADTDIDSISFDVSVSF